MNKLFAIGLALIALTFSPNTAQAFLCCGDECGSESCCTTSEGFYVGFFAGGYWWNKPNGSSASATGEFIEFDTDWGYTFGGTAGWRWCNGHRFELEAAYREGDIDAIVLFDSAGSGVSTESTDRSEITTITYMANFLHECSLSICGCCYRPFAGFGIGIATTKMESRSSSFEIDETDVSFAYQLIMGVAYPINPCLDLSVEYRFLNVSEPGLTADGVSFDVHSWMRSHAVVVNMKYVFMGLFPLY